MNVNVILYAVTPFGLALLLKKFVFVDNQTISYLSLVGVGCIASLFIYSKFIVPRIENKYNTFSRRDKMNDLLGKYGTGAATEANTEFHYEEQQKNDKELKPYTYVAWSHVALLVLLIITYFIK